jgi:ribonuclease HI
MSASNTKTETPSIRLTENVNKSESEPRTIKTFHIFTDGACSDNGRRGARAGFGLHIYSELTGVPRGDRSEPLLRTEQQTNNRAELRGIQAALDFCESYMRNIETEYGEVCIWTDSEYSLNSLTKWAPGWKLRSWKKSDGGLIQNLDLIRSLYDRLQTMPHIRLQHVRAHQDKRKNEFPWSGNAIADKLAREATQISVHGTSFLGSSQSQ